MKRKQSKRLLLPNEMFRQILTRNHNQIKAIAEAWLSSGANYFGILENGVPLFEFRSRRTGDVDQKFQVLQAPIDLNTTIELRIPAFEIPAAEARFRAETDLLLHIIRLSSNLEGLTTELIDSQDQLLAIYNLTQRTRNYIDLDELLKQLARETSELLKADSAFVIFDMPGEAVIGKPLFRHGLSRCTSNRSGISLQ